MQGLLYAICDFCSTPETVFGRLRDPVACGGVSVRPKGCCIGYNAADFLRLKVFYQGALRTGFAVSFGDGDAVGRNLTRLNLIQTTTTIIIIGALLTSRIQFNLGPDGWRHLPYALVVVLDLFLRFLVGILG